MMGQVVIVLHAIGKRERKEHTFVPFLFSCFFHFLCFAVTTLIRLLDFSNKKASLLFFLYPLYTVYSSLSLLLQLLLYIFQSQLRMNLDQIHLILQEINSTKNSFSYTNQSNIPVRQILNPFPLYESGKTSLSPMNISLKRCSHLR